MAARGLRNNNPGNIRYDKKQIWQGEIRGSRKKDKAFCEFVSMAYGYRALLKTLINYRKLYGLKTISEMIARWAPPSENDTRRYAAFVASEMGTDAASPVDVDDGDEMCRMAAAISRFENGEPAVMADVRAGWKLM